MAESGRSAAAIAASRAGAGTYLVERYNHLGGLGQADWFFHYFRPML